MKSALLAAALGSSVALAHPRHTLPTVTAYNTTGNAAIPSGTGDANCTSAAAISTLVDAEGTARNSSGGCGCTTALTTTTIFVYSTAVASFNPFPTSSVVNGTTSRDENTYLYSIVNGTTVWEDDRTPPPSAATTYYLTSTAWVVPAEITSTDITLTITTQRTLTSTHTSASSWRTETVVVFETVPTTVHITRSASSAVPTFNVSTVPAGGVATISGLDVSTIVDGSVDSTTTTSAWTTETPAAGSGSAVIPSLSSSASVPLGINGSTSSIDVQTTRPQASNSTAGLVSTHGSGNVTPSPSEQGGTVVVTASRTSIITRPRSSSTVALAWNSSVVDSSHLQTSVFSTGRPSEIPSNVSSAQPSVVLSSQNGSSIGGASAQPSSLPLSSASWINGTGPASNVSSTTAATLSSAVVTGDTLFNRTSSVTGTSRTFVSPFPSLWPNSTGGVSSSGSLTGTGILSTGGVSISVSPPGTAVSATSGLPLSGSSTGTTVSSSSGVLLPSMPTGPTFMSTSGFSSSDSPADTAIPSTTTNAVSFITVLSTVPCTTLSNGSVITNNLSLTVINTDILGDATASFGPALTTSQPFVDSSDPSPPFANSTLAYSGFTSAQGSNVSSTFAGAASALPLWFTSSTSELPCTISGSHTHDTASNATEVATLPASSGGNAITSTFITTSRPATSALPPWSNIQDHSTSFHQSGEVVTASSSTIDSWVTSFTTVPLTFNSSMSTITYGQAPPYPTSSPENFTIANATSPCGETGNFTINWDDKPLYIPDSLDDEPYAPVFNPYHHLFFANGFSYYAPDHSLTHPATYDPVSGPNVAIYKVDPSITIDDRDQKIGNMLPGAIGAGPRADDSVYWFDAFSAELGCDNGGSAPCNMTISGYTWNGSTQVEDKDIVQYAQIPPCNQLQDCILEHVQLQDFRGLSSIRFEAVVDGATLKSWVVDNLSLEWFDNSCEAGMKRTLAKK